MEPKKCGGKHLEEDRKGNSQEDVWSETEGSKERVGVDGTVGFEGIRIGGRLTKWFEMNGSCFEERR